MTRGLAQHGAQDGGKGLLALLVHLHLVDPGDLILDRVLHREDVLGHAVDVLEERVEERALAASRRSVTATIPWGRWP